ncbi:hypothetical protein ACS0TY_017401 [Phlomoides rotata]
MGENQISGTISTHICTQSAKLQDLFLNSNQFEGEFPSAVIRCHSLKTLHLGANKFTGNIPAEFWNLSAIQRVELPRNKFTENNLSGYLPFSIDKGLPIIERFVIHSNLQFHGKIPSSISNLSKLTLLELSRELTMRRWVTKSFPNSVMQIVDDELLNMDDQRSRARHERCWTSAIELALECTTDLAEERPNMKLVVAK